MKMWRPQWAVLLILALLLTACNGDDPAELDTDFVAPELGIGFDYPDDWYARDDLTVATVSTFEVSPEEDGGSDHTRMDIQVVDTANIIPPGQTLTSYVAGAREEFGPSFVGSDITEIDGHEAAIIILQEADSLGMIALISDGTELVLARGSTQVVNGAPAIDHEDFRALEDIIRSIRFMEE